MRSWSLQKKFGVSVVFPLVFLVLVCLLVHWETGRLYDATHLVTHAHEALAIMSHIMEDVRECETSQRGYVITGDETFLENLARVERGIAEWIRQMQALIRDPGQLKRVEDLRQHIDARISRLKEVARVRKTAGLEAAAREISSGLGRTKMANVSAVYDEFVKEEQRILKQRDERAAWEMTVLDATLLGVVLVVSLITVLQAFFLSRSVATPITSAVLRIQSASTQLQAAAAQLAAGAKEQSTTASEVTSTIQELLSTSQQIAASAQNVAGLASRTAVGAAAGQDTVGAAQEGVDGIKRQVDGIVAQMLELGKKSQRVGGILDIINELAEQTTILAINATIEAAGAGEHGKRFGVVADEIRRLADRVGSSTRDIRSLIDDIRSSVNTTVMATEGGVKAVATGLKQFEAVTASFESIGGLVVTTSEAAHEIELSTKQQTTGVDQVTLAMSAVLTASRESEASAGQTLQTATELANLAAELARVIKPGA